ncbi:MAG: DUF465 domain-containing protein [Hyphomonas sp.]|tara:strand:- start:5235 stop:5420 length:186 start_codon:yes stop_codon:yes gene_type:complete
MNQGIISHRGRLLHELRRRCTAIESEISDESRRPQPNEQLLRALKAKRMAVKDMMARRSQR